MRVEARRHSLIVRGVWSMPELSPQANLRQDRRAYMRDHLGPLQGILEQVVRVDSL
jgi:hypothetical protein